MKLTDASCILDILDETVLLLSAQFADKETVFTGGFYIRTLKFVIPLCYSSLLRPTDYWKSAHFLP